MPEREFELYLSLLSRFLRLKPAQRDEIADELRDHLEARLEELAAKGISREQAIQAALDEFGDAADLAQHFTQHANRRRRRFIMRCTAGTVAALVVGMLAVTAFWPGARAPLPVQVAAESGRPATTEIAAVAGPLGLLEGVLEKKPWGDLSTNPAEEKIRASLKVPTDVDFADTALDTAINFLKSFHGINILVDVPTLTDEAIPTDTPMTLSLHGVTFKSVLNLLLEPLGLTYVIEDEVMKITTATKAGEKLIIRVFDVRDLVTQFAKSAADIEASTALVRGKAEPAGEGMGMLTSIPRVMNSAPSAAPRDPTSSLATVISQTIEDDSWNEVGGQGSIIGYNGLLIVRQTQKVQGDIVDFLKLLRKVLELPPAEGHRRAESAPAGAAGK
ncbi:MAG: permease prefix domain 1-containing protein [Planctomycetaceae bacterium]